MAFEAAPRNSLPEVIAFLRDVFQAPQSPNLNPALLAWKYYANGPEWQGSRSYVLRKDGEIVSHSGIWPIRLGTASGDVNALQAVDWAGARKTPGAGVSLLNKLRKLAPVLITVGGSKDTQRVLPSIGFRQWGTSGLYARVLRAFGQFRTRPAEGARGLPRLLRNAVWSRDPIAPVEGWTHRPAAHPSAEELARFSERNHESPESLYTAPFLEFMMRCPAAAIEYFELLRDGAPQGYFVLSRVGGQTRLADLRILSRETKDLASAYAVAVRAAARDRLACELVTSASLHSVREALIANGFRNRGENPVFVLDPLGLLGNPAHLHLSMLDDDSAYLNFPETPYCT